MELQLYMLGVTVKDMDKSLEFYRRLGLAIPEKSDGQSHIEVKMRGEMTFFLDSKPIRKGRLTADEIPDGYDFLLEFYLKNRAAVDAKYTELTGFGYQSYREPFEVPSIAMYFALVNDPDGNTILLSSDMEENKTSQDG